MKFVRVLALILVVLAMWLLLKSHTQLQHLADLYSYQNTLQRSRPSYPFHNYPSTPSFQTGTPSYYLNTSGAGIFLGRSLQLSVTRDQGGDDEPNHIVQEHREGPQEAVMFDANAQASSVCEKDAMTVATEKLRRFIEENALDVTNEQLDGSDACTTTGVTMTVAVPTDQLDRVTADLERVLVADGKQRESKVKSKQQQKSDASSSISGPSHFSVFAADMDGATTVLRNTAVSNELADNSNSVVGPLEVAREVARRRYTRYHAVVYQDDLDKLLADQQRADQKEKQQKHQEEAEQPEEEDDLVEKLKSTKKELNVSRAMVFLDGLRNVETQLVTVEHELKAAKEKLQTLRATLEVRLVDRDVRAWRIIRNRDLVRVESKLSFGWLVVGLELAGAVASFLIAVVLGRRKACSPGAGSLSC